MTQVADPAVRNNGVTEATTVQAARPSKVAWWIGAVISTLVFLWMGVLGAVLVLFNRAMVVEGMTKYGYPASAVVPVLIIEIISAILYVIPQTAVLGAILLTGYLGGAVATHVRAGEPWFMPVIAGVLVWLGLVLRDPKLRALTPLRRV